MGHWHDIVGRRLRQLVDEFDDSGQLFDRFGEFVIGEAEARQHRNVLNLFFIE
jgi:hypothetical protein